MKPFLSLLLLLFFGQTALCQDQLAVRVNEKGILKILQMALKYNTSNEDSRVFILPENLYRFTIKEQDLLSNPIVQTINQISNLNMNEDLNFFFHTKAIKINGDVNAQSLKATILNSRRDGFDVKLELNLPQIEINGSEMSLCQEANKKKCGKGLKATIKNLKIKTLNHPVTMTAILRLTIKDSIARIKVVSVDSNLDKNDSGISPDLDIDFSSVIVPELAIIIAGQETILDTSKLRDEILKREEYLSKKLLEVAGDFIANKTAQMVNDYLVNSQVATSFQVYSRNDPVVEEMNPLISYQDLPRYQVMAQDNTYLRMPIRYIPKKDVIKSMLETLADIIRQAQVNVAMETIRTPGNKDIEIGGIVDLILNHQRIQIEDTLGNSSQTLPLLDLNSHRNNDLNLAISEPLINGALELAGGTGLFQEIFEEVADVPGFSIENIKIHFKNKNSLDAVVNASIDLKKLGASVWSQPGKWIKNNIAKWFERNNNNSVIYFPIQVEIIPSVIKLPKGGVGLEILIKSPFVNGKLLNTYKYDSNVDKMTELVRSGVLKELRTSLKDVTDQRHKIDITRFLNQGGVEFLPKSLVFKDSAYLLLNLDIVDIKPSIFKTK